MTKSNRRTFLKQIPKIAISTLFLFNSTVKKTEAARSVSQANMIIVWKSKRRMGLFINKKLLKSYRIRLGFSPVGHKKREGDGKTPEGRYFITHHNPKSLYHMSLGLSYPNKEDKRNARDRQVSPGKDIFIHGGPKNIFVHFFKDWTNGCIAVLDHEIEEIYKLVPDGTVVYIYS